MIRSLALALPLLLAAAGADAAPPRPAESFAYPAVPGLRLRVVGEGRAGPETYLVVAPDSPQAFCAARAGQDCNKLLAGVPRRLTARCDTAEFSTLEGEWARLRTPGAPAERRAFDVRGRGAVGPGMPEQASLSEQYDRLCRRTPAR